MSHRHNVQATMETRLGNEELKEVHIGYIYIYMRTLYIGIWMHLIDMDIDMQEFGVLLLASHV